jgi:hypothetical protein
MAKLPGWIKVVKMDRANGTMVIVIRWWHPHMWVSLWKDGEQTLIDNGVNPFTVAMRWKRIKAIAKTIWEFSAKSWLVE